MHIKDSGQWTVIKERRQHRRRRRNLRRQLPLISRAAVVPTERERVAFVTNIKHRLSASVIGFKVT